MFEYNMAIHDLRAISAELITLRARIADVQKNAARASDPTLAGLTGYLGALYQGLQDDAMTLLFQACQAFHFKYLQAPKTAFESFQEKLLWAQGVGPSFTFKDLETAITNLKLDAVKTETTKGWKPDSFGPSTSAPRVYLRFDDAANIAALKQDRRLGFTTVPSAAAGKTEQIPHNTSDRGDIRVAQVLVRVFGAQTKGKHLLMYIRHGGRDRFVTIDDLTVEFTHTPIRIPLTIDLTVPASQPYKWATGDGDLTGGGYLQPGLFTDWEIEFPAANPIDTTNDGLDLSQVTAIEIDFSGTYRLKTNVNMNVKIGGAI